MNANKKIFFWLDLEMTGLGDDQFIIEIASAITDDDLKASNEGCQEILDKVFGILLFYFFFFFKFLNFFFF